MRESQTITIGGEAVQVSEVPARRIGKLFGLVSELARLPSGDDAAMGAFLETHWDGMLALLADCCSAGEAVSGYGGQATVRLLRAFVEVNAPFFAELAGMKAEMARAGQAGSGQPPTDPTRAGA